MMNECPRTRELFASLEAMFTVVPEPIPAAQFAEAVNVEEVFVLEVLEDLTASYRDEDGGREHGFELRQNTGDWRIHSVHSWTDLMGRFIVSFATPHLSQVALETLAVIVYRQPVSRSRISHVRGMNIDVVTCTLVTRGLIEGAGESALGARLYGTTREFLREMGFASLDELTPLAPYLPTGEGLDELEEFL